jgi:hypothetical protein
MFWTLSPIKPPRIKPNLTGARRKHRELFHKTKRGHYNRQPLAPAIG